MLLNVWNKQENAGESESQSDLDPPLWIKIHELSGLTLQHLSQNTLQNPLLLKQLQNKYYRVLYGGKDPRGPIGPKECGFESDKEHECSHPYSSDEASEKYSVESIQWKNNQKQTISTTIEQIVIMLIRKHEAILKNIPSPFRDATNRNPQSQHKNTKQTETSTPQRCTLAHDSIYLASENCQDRCTLQQKTNIGKESLHAQQKHGLEKILELLKVEREKLSKLKQHKQCSSQKLWETYGFLMHLQRQKFQQNYIFERRQPVQEKLLRELTAKNMVNQKIINKYTKKIQSQSSQKKMLKQKSMYSMRQSLYAEQAEWRDCLQGYESPSWKLTLQKASDLKKSNTKIYTIRSKPKQAAYSLSSTVQVNSPELRQQEIKAKVESSFRQVKKYESLGKNILSSIVFDPDSMLTTYKRRWMNKNNNERNGMRRFEKSIQNNRLLLRVGGIRLSLQECGFKGKYTCDNA